MDHDEREDAPRGVPRRTLMRTVAWSTPAVVAAVGPLTVTAYKNILTQVVIQFSGGQSNLSVTVVSVTVRFNGTMYDVNNSPDTVSSTSGATYGRLLSAWFFLTLNYTVSYIFNGQTYTTVVSA